VLCGYGVRAGLAAKSVEKDSARDVNSKEGSAGNLTNVPLGLLWENREAGRTVNGKAGSRTHTSDTAAFLNTSNEPQIPGGRRERAM
jgi:hypothetical protein